MKQGLVLLLCALAAPPCLARYAAVETKKVPIARLLDATAKELKKAPKDFALLARDARLHAMAYALGAGDAEVEVAKDGKGEEPWYGHEPKRLPFAGAGTGMGGKTANEHLEKAVDSYRRALELKPDDEVVNLGLAWTLAKSGKQAEAMNRLRQVIEAGWKKDKDTGAGHGSNWSLTEEAIGYLKPLLDPKKDAEELGRYEERLKVLATRPRDITPVVLPLGKDLSYQSITAGVGRVGFDLDGRAPHACRWSWVSPQTGIMVYDPDGSGQVGSGLQLFGSVTWWLFWDDGYQALAALDDDGDGWLRGDELRGIAVWRDANGDGVSQPGEVVALGALGIEALGVTAARNAEGILHGQVVRAGVVVPSYDWVASCR